MALVRFRPLGSVDPFRDLGDIQSEMNRMFDNVFGRGPQSQAMERVWAPAVDMYETKEDLVVKAELPGVSEKDIHLSVNGDMLSLKGERRWEHETTHEGVYRMERWYGKFERTLPLPFPVEAGKVKANYREGVLTVSLPKAEQIRPRDIKIDVA
jgi:HSP20 family protein